MSQSKPGEGSASPSAQGDRSTSELVRTVRDDLRALVSEELQNARSELGESARQAGRAGALLGAAAGLGVLATAMSAVAVLRALGKLLPPTTAAAVAAALYGAGAVAAGSAGMAELRRAGPLWPERTLASLEADVKAVMDAVDR